MRLGPVIQPRPSPRARNPGRQREQNATNKFTLAEEPAECTKQEVNGEFGALGERGWKLGAQVARPVPPSQRDH